jgi:hypothetical protein
MERLMERQQAPITPPVAASTPAHSVPTPRRERAVLAAAALFLLLPALFMPPRTFGDSGEYFLTLESLVNHGTPDLQGQDLALMSVRMVRYPVTGSFRTLQAYRTGRTGALYAQHFWAYPASALPVRFVLRKLGVHEFKAFQITNALLLLGAVWVCLRHAPYPWRWRVLAVALLLSGPLAWFVMLPHPEVYSASLVVMALCWWRSGAAVKAILAAALAALQNPPLMLLVAFLWTHAVLAAPHPRWRRFALASAAAAVAAAPYVFNLYAFGTPSLIARENIHYELMRPWRALELIYDPNIGFVRCSLLTLLVAFGATVAAVARRHARAFVASAWALVVAMAHVCSGMADWNHGTSGPSRYTLWLLPLLVWIICEVWAHARSVLPAAAAGAAAVAQLSVFVARGGFRAPEDYLQHSWGAHLLLTHRPSLYTPTHEIFAERTSHRDWHPEVDRVQPVLFTAEGRCLKALAQKRHAQALRATCGAEPAAFTEHQARVKERSGGRSFWMYVDYE